MTWPLAAHMACKKATITTSSQGNGQAIQQQTNSSTDWGIPYVRCQWNQLKADSANTLPLAHAQGGGGFMLS
jgi:hypothetical protein